LPESETLRISKLSYISFFYFIVVQPALAVIFMGDPAEILEQLAISPILLLYMPTIVFQWLLFALILVTVYRERTGLKGIGFTGIRLIHFMWAIAFLLISNFLLSILALGLSYFGIEIPGELGLILPGTTVERIFWVVLSLTAGIVEETIFRGYLITRIKQFGRLKSWLIPIVISSLAFGSGHTYQGLGGFILISIYGAMYAFLFIRTKSLWPCIIAHFFQDFSAIFYPYQS